MHSKDETCCKYSKLLQYIYFKCYDTAVNKIYKKHIDINKQQLLFKNINSVLKSWCKKLTKLILNGSDMYVNNCWCVKAYVQSRTNW